MAVTRWVIPEGRLYLTIFPNGAYSQSFEPKAGGLRVTRTGKWNLRRDKDRIEFHDFMSVDKRFSRGDLEQETSKRLDALLGFSSRSGQVEMIYVNENYEGFRRL